MAAHLIKNTHWGPLALAWPVGTIVGRCVFGLCVCWLLRWLDDRVCLYTGAGAFLSELSASVVASDG